MSHLIRTVTTQFSAPKLVVLFKLGKYNAGADDADDDDEIVDRAREGARVVLELYGEDFMTAEIFFNMRRVRLTESGPEVSALSYGIW